MLTVRQMKTVVYINFITTVCVSNALLRRDVSDNSKYRTSKAARTTLLTVNVSFA